MSGLLRVIDVLYKTCALLSQLIMVCSCSHSLLSMALSGAPFWHPPWPSSICLIYCLIDTPLLGSVGV